MTVKENRKQEARLEMLNNLTKKYFLVTIVILAIVIYLIAGFIGAIKSNQQDFRDFPGYKYLIVFFSFLIPAPFLLTNYLRLKKLNHSLDL